MRVNVLAFAITATLPRNALGQCSTAEIMDVEGVIATCCESVAGNCVESFPATCSHLCSHVLVPYADSCGEMLVQTFDGVEGVFAFSVSKFNDFAVACRQTLVLYERASTAGSCGADDTALKARVDAVNTACCEQDGINVCAETGGAPMKCDAECAAEFLPYFDECLDDRSMIGGEMHQFTVLFTQCTDQLPESESLILYQDVISMDDSGECRIDTSLVISRAEAKKRQIIPVCETDAFPICNRMITASAKSCKVDYCETCPEAHSCDHECGYPCAGGANGGHRRFLAELGTFTSIVAEKVGICPFDRFQSTLQQLDGECCGTDGGFCADNAQHTPTSCPYRCGRLWTEFYEECQTLLQTFVGDLSHYTRFSDRCLDMDPVGMAVALRGADCSVCGDGDVSAEKEQCDDGDGNSDEPGASCRPNCQPARCGDYIVDPNEDCDPPSEESGCDEKCHHAGFKYVGCVEERQDVSSGWVRPDDLFTDCSTPYSADGAEQCLQGCLDKGYRYGGLECPLSTRHDDGRTAGACCQCASDGNTGDVDSNDRRCERIGGGCDLDPEHEGYNFGGGNRGSVYDLSPDSQDEQCEIEFGIDYQDSTTNIKFIDDVESAIKCAELCSAEPLCKSFSRTKNSYSTPRRCYLKGSVKPNRQPADCCDSGLPCTPDLVLGEAGSNDCPQGYESVSEGECQATAESLLPIEETMGRSLQVGNGDGQSSGSWGGVPPRACSVQSGGDWAPHFNTGGGSNAGIYSLVCKRASAAASQWVYDAAFAGQSCYQICRSTGGTCSAADETMMTSFVAETHTDAATTTALADTLTCYQSTNSGASVELMPFAYADNIEGGGVDCRVFHDSRANAGSTCAGAQERVARICHCNAR
jgi:hypothetical protein